MARIVVVGDGPAGLSAALFLAKNDQDVVVYGQDGTAVHYALLRNQLGIEEIDGPEFVERSRAQAAKYGAQLLEGRVVTVAADADGVSVTTEDGDEVRGDYLVLAAAKKGGELARQLGLEAGDDGVPVNHEYRTDSDRVYAVGRLVRPRRSQVVISAGAGAVAALDILAREAGEDVVDWDSRD